jgi:hypothetical protein
MLKTIRNEAAGDTFSSPSQVPSRDGTLAPLDPATAGKAIRRRKSMAAMRTLLRMVFIGVSPRKGYGSLYSTTTAVP